MTQFGKEMAWKCDWFKGHTNHLYLCIIVASMKRTKQQNFQTIWTKVSLVLNLGHGIKKSKAKTQGECKRTLLQKHDKNKKI
jgi:hypothetical protein